MVGGNQLCWPSSPLKLEGHSDNYCLRVCAEIRWLFLCVCVFWLRSRDINKVTRHKMHNVLLLLMTIVGSATGELVIIIM